MRGDGAELARLRERVAELEDTLEAIRGGTIDALVVSQGDSLRVYTLEGADEPYRQMVEHMKEGAATLGPTGDVLFANAALADTLGLPLSRVIGARFVDAFVERHRAEVQALLDGALEHGTSRGEVLLETGVPAYLTVSRMDLGGLAATCVTVTDLTRQRVHLELAEKARELELANRSLADYASVVSHDLKAPLRGMWHQVEYLKEDHPDAPPAILAHLDSLARSAQDALRMVDGLLELGATSTRKLVTERIPLGDALRGALCRVRLPPDAEVAVALDQHEVEGDRLLVEQVLANLVSNAVKYNTSSRKRVDVSCAPSGPGHVRIAVRDNGIGIEERYHERIFRMFERVDADPLVEGNGVGLAIVAKAVARMGGELGLESEPGHGSTFYVKLRTAGPPPPG